MKLHTVIVSHNRLELTKRTVASYLETVSVPHTLWLVDNHSGKEMRQWLIDNYDYGLTLLNENRYPGYATNRGWEHAPDDADFFQRADNDHIFLPGWCEAVEHEFEPEKVGLVGMRTSEEELHEKWNTGGNCVIRRELWEKGLRWDERPWPQLRDELGEGITEDSLMAPAVVELGYTWTRVRRPCIQPISPEMPSDPDWPYYLQTFRDRGIHKHLTEEVA